MDIEIYFGLFVSGAVAMIFVHRSTSLFDRLVWVRTDATIVEADVTYSRNFSSFLDVTVTLEVRQTAKGRFAEPASVVQHQKSFTLNESLNERWSFKETRIARAYAMETIDLWYAQEDPSESYITYPSYFRRCSKGIAGILFGGALFGYTLCLALFDPERVLDFLPCYC